MDAVALAKFAYRGKVDQIGEQLVQPAAIDEGLHRHLRIVLAQLFHRVGRRALKIGIVDARLADAGHPVAPGDAAELAGTGDIAAGKGDPDQDQEAHGDANAQLGAKEIAEKLQHCLLEIPLRRDPADLLRALGGIRASRNGTGRNGVGQMS